MERQTPLAPQQQNTHPLWQQFQQELHNQQQTVQSLWQQFTSRQNQPVLSQQFQQELQNQQQAVENLWRNFVAGHGVQGPQDKQSMQQQFLDLRWQEFVSSRETGLRQEFLDLRWQEFLSRFNAPVQQAKPVTVWNPSGSTNNCVHTCCAYLLGGGHTADSVARLTGIPVAAPGSYGLSIQQVDLVVQGCGLLRKVRTFEYVDSLFEYLLALKGGEDDTKLGTYLVRFDRSGGTGHAVILNVDGTGWRWLDPQVPNANVDDIEGLTGAGAERWQLMGPY
ncbi:hypothetical protein LG634_19315 [Streptomyces bambusae]|uniref:hypothetical protein n=1 Tax=Streptomyces bambusae TaxID=1550616 RepID=UPI001CFCBE75|nr:hypothetical protein [Streptomyces bambusae]MCB5166980.1 hypothetical protein [Streptomyces bambusae]